MFIQQDEKFIFIEEKTDMLHSKLQPGVYSAVITETGPWSPPKIHYEQNNSFKKYPLLNSGVYKKATDHVEQFFSEEMREINRQLECKQKLGIVFNGIQGSGKSVLAGQIANLLVEKHDAVGVIINRAWNFKSIVDAIRKEDPNRLVVLILDEFEKWYQKIPQPELLGFLDGPDSPNNILIIPTTNSSESFPSTLNARPGRIEQIYEFDTVSPELTKNIVCTLLPKELQTPELVDNLVKRIIQLPTPTIDYIRVLVRNTLYQLKTNNILPDVPEAKKRKQIGFAMSSTVTEEESNNHDKNCKCLICKELEEAFEKAQSLSEEVCLN